MNQKTTPPRWFKVSCSIVLLLPFLICAGVFTFAVTSPPNAATQIVENLTEEKTQKNVASSLDLVLAHKGSKSLRNRSQIIAATMTKDELTLKNIADDLRVKYEFENVLVNFYTDPAVVERFNGTAWVIDEATWIGYVAITPSEDRIDFKRSPF